MIDSLNVAPKTSSASALSRRNFLARTSYLGALFAACEGMPLRALGAEFADDSRVAQAVIADKGFASVRKIGEGLYATISDTSKGFQTTCNGGFLVGKDGVLLLEGFASPGGAAFQFETMRSVTQTPVKAALETHYHYDHSMGNSFYGAQGIALWAHAATPKRIVSSYASLQGLKKDTALAALEKALKEAKDEAARKRREGLLGAIGSIFDLVNATVLALPNHPLDPARLPMKLDLGGLTASIEHYPGHSGTDILVRVPEQNVVYTGDLLFDRFYPVCFDEQATVSGWRQTLKTFASWDKDTLFVPGHGQVSGQETVALFRSLFDDIDDQAQKLHKAGVPADEAVDRYEVPEKFKNIYIFSWDLTIAPTIRKLYEEWGVR